MNFEGFLIGIAKRYIYCIKKVGAFRIPHLKYIGVWGQGAEGGEYTMRV